MTLMNLLWKFSAIMEPPYSVHFAAATVGTSRHLSFFMVDKFLYRGFAEHMCPQTSLLAS